MIATIFDTETTGLIENPARKLESQPEIISIGIQSVNLVTGEYFEPYYRTFKPTKSISQEIYKITGLNDETVKDSLPFHNHVDEVVTLLEGAQLLIGQNISFDMGMVNTELLRLNRKIKWPKRLDLVENSIYLKGFRLSLTNLHIELFGEEFKGAHRADVDVLITCKCAIEMYKRGWL